MKTWMHVSLFVMVSALVITMFISFYYGKEARHKNYITTNKGERMKNSMDSFREHYFKKGYKEGEAAGLKRGLEFALWFTWHKFPTIEEAFEYWCQNVEGKK